MSNLTRRDFLKVAGIGTAATAAAVALAGCSSSDDDSSSSTSTSSTTSSSSTSDTSTSTSTVTAPDSTITSSSEDAHTTAHQISDLIMYRTGNDIETFLNVNSENASDAMPGNVVENWIGQDLKGNIIYLAADSYETNDDSSVWTFHLRDGITWVDNQCNYKADLKVTDFLVGAEFILNYHKNSGKCASMLTTNVKGALDYYEYTKTLSEDEGMALTYKDTFADMVGIVADTSANTVTYTCTDECPYFWSLGYHKCTSAIAEDLVDEIGAANMAAINWDQLWSCSGYVVSDFVAGNNCTLTKNTAYWNYDNTSLFDSVTSLLIESTDVGYQLYINGEIDQISLSQSNLVNILSDSSNDFYDYVVKQYGTTGTYSIHFNYSRVNPDTNEPDTVWNTVVANTNFRKAIYWGLDLEGYYSYTDPVTPFSVAGYTFTQNNFVSIDGVDYQDYVISLLGLEKSNDYDSRYDPDKAAEYMAAAVEELTAEGITFPVTMTYYIQAGSQSALDQATLLKTAFDEAFDGYIDFQLDTYVSSVAKEVVSFKYHCFMISGWTADYSDPSNCIEQISLTTTSNAYLDYSCATDLTEGPAYELFQEFTDLCWAARAITGDLTERYKAYAEAEAFALENCLIVPMYVNSKWQLTKINDYSKNLKGANYQNYETNSEGYTTADYNTFAEEFANS